MVGLAWVMWPKLCDSDLMDTYFAIFKPPRAYNVSKFIGTWDCYGVEPLKDRNGKYHDLTRPIPWPDRL